MTWQRCSSTAKRVRRVSASATAWSTMPAWTLRSIAADRRKDPTAKMALMREVDLVILCLPDAASRETVRLVDEIGSGAPKILDASTAYRVAPNWVYGFPELDRGQTGGDRLGPARQQPRLLRDRRHRTAASSGRGRADPSRLAHHHQCGERLQRRRQEYDRGLRGRQGTGFRALRPRYGTQAPTRNSGPCGPDAAAYLRAVGRKLFVKEWW